MHVWSDDAAAMKARIEREVLGRAGDPGPARTRAENEWVAAQAGR